MSEKKMRFQRLGGTCQLAIAGEKDFANIPELKDPLWAMTSAKTEAFLCDKDFLACLDADANGRIRVDEVKRQVKWQLSLLKDLSRTMKGSDVLDLNAINRETPEGEEIYQTCVIALANHGLADAKEISLSQISDQKKIISDALQNGDGVIPPGAVSDKDAAEWITKIMSMIGKKKDLSGQEGISEEELGAFETQAKARVAWLEQCEKENAKIMPFGDKTDSIFAAYSELAERLDAFFRCCEALSLSEETADKRLAVQNTLDPMDAASVENFLAKAPIASVNTGCELDLNKVRHPLWRVRILNFFRSIPDAPENIIPLEYWRSLKEKLAPCGAWKSAKPETKIEACSADELRKVLAGGTIPYIRDLIAKDKVVEKNLNLCGTVRKLILYQKNMLEFVNNFVSLDRMFDSQATSMIQAGKLVMDGRYFSLCTILQNPAEHKKISQDSNVCVMYLDLVNGKGAAEKKMKVAVAVTSGSMRHLFIGKSGVFYTGDGEIWDAKIFDFIQQPVSISEALKMPFYKFADFLQKQADKFFTSRSKQFEDTVAKDIQAQSALPTAQTQAKPAPQQTPAFSGSMVLMGGGVGIAAIGSAFAFMAKSIQGISIGTVLAVFLSILLIFGGPIVIISLNKLFHRNLSIFLEANGFALNGQMRLSLRMGRFFTYSPPFPGYVPVFNRAYRNTPDSQEAIHAKKWRRIFLCILLFILFAECVLLAWIHFGNFAEFWGK